MKIPPEAIEAACVARYGEKWDDPDVSERAMHAARNQMAKWLTAALPHILGEAEGRIAALEAEQVRHIEALEWRVRNAALEEAAAMFDEVAAAHRARAERLREVSYINAHHINAHHDAMVAAAERSADAASIRALRARQAKAAQSEGTKP